MTMKLTSPLSRFACRFFSAKTQSGGICLLMVILLMGISLLLLTRLNNQVFSLQKEGQQDIVRLTAVYQAQSALAFGEVNCWSDQKSWQCERYPDYGFMSCFKPLNERDGIIKGISFAKPYSIPITRYKRMEYVLSKEGSCLEIIPYSHSWLDYCPVSEESFCDEAK